MIFLPRMRSSAGRAVTVALLAGVLIVVTLLSLGIGSFRLPPGEILRILLERPEGKAEEVSAAAGRPATHDLSTEDTL